MAVTYFLPKGVHKNLKLILKKCQTIAKAMKLLKKNKKGSGMCKLCFIIVLKLKYKLIQISRTNQ